MPPRTRSNTRENTLPEGVDRGVGASKNMHGDELTSLLSNIMVDLKELRENQVSMHANQNVLFEEIVALKETRPSRSVTPKNSPIIHHVFEGNNGEEEYYGGCGGRGGGRFGNENGINGRRGNRGPENNEWREYGDYGWNGGYGRDRYYEEEPKPRYDDPANSIKHTFPEFHGRFDPQAY